MTAETAHARMLRRLHDATTHSAVKRAATQASIQQHMEKTGETGQDQGGSEG